MTLPRGHAVWAGLAIAALGAGGWFAVGMTDAGARGEARGPASPDATVRIAPAPPVPTLSWGASATDFAAAKVAASHVPLDVAAGQVIVAAVSSPDPAAAAALVTSDHLAGVIVMGPAVTDGPGVQALTAAVADAVAGEERGWPAIVSVDQEGGPVARLAGLVPDMPAFMAAGAAPDKSAVTAAYTAAATDLATLGFTVDWAPVADVTIGAADPTIGVRSAGSDPVNVAATVVAAVNGYMAGGVVPAVKHFPGHGSVTTDSHAALPLQQAAVADLAATDLVPFQAAIDAGAPMVMMGHIAVPEWGGGAATVSPAAYAYLRGPMGFDGVAVTDALNMGALSASFPGQLEVQALAAGADLLLFPADPAAARAAIIAAVTTGELPRARLDEAIARVSLVMQARTSTAAPVTDPSYARSFAAASAVVAGSVCEGPVVGGSVTISGGGEGERAALYAALAEHGIGKGSGTRVRILGPTPSSGSADVVVAMDVPWSLPSWSATTYVGLFGRSDDALAALADVLSGAVDARGQWPVGGMPAACG